MAKTVSDGLAVRTVSVDVVYAHADQHTDHAAAAVAQGQDSWQLLLRAKVCRCVNKMARVSRSETCYVTARELRHRFTLPCCVWAVKWSASAARLLRSAPLHHSTYNTLILACFRAGQEGRDAGRHHTDHSGVILSRWGGEVMCSLSVCPQNYCDVVALRHPEKVSLLMVY
jgi:hypothetical protein